MFSLIGGWKSGSLLLFTVSKALDFFFANAQGKKRKGNFPLFWTTLHFVAEGVLKITRYEMVVWYGL